MLKVRIASRDLIPSYRRTCHCHALAEDGHRDLYQPVQDQTSQRLSHPSDTSITLFALYLQRAEKLDWAAFKLLKGDTDQILVFVSP
jgi:hypothetical protein